MIDVLISLRAVVKSYSLGGSHLGVLSGLNVDFHRNELITIQGASGTGKTTLLHLLGGLDKPDRGTISWKGQDIAEWSGNQLARWRRDQIGLVFQSYHLLPELNAQENVNLPALIGGQSDPNRAKGLLEQVGLERRMSHRPSELSGGEQQRVAIARALFNRPQLVLADEPTGNLDRTTGERVISILLKLCREREATLILVTHDSSLAAVGSRRLVLEGGVLTEAGSTRTTGPR